ncbi:MAG: hypothetical protein ACT4NJ_07915 [Nitrosopumilaceae archaeon]
MISDFSPFLSDITLILLMISVGIFGSLAVQARSLKSFQFHISLIVIVWIVGEIIGISNQIGLIELVEFESLPEIIHLLAMVLIGLVFWMRFYFAKRSGKKLIEEIYD